MLSWKINAALSEKYVIKRILKSIDLVALPCISEHQETIPAALGSLVSDIHMVIVP